MKIGELAASAHCDVATVRYYEREGLMPAPSRTASNYRAYGPRHMERLRFIRRCRSLDMDLREIRLLLSFVDRPEEKCGRVNEALDRHIEHVEARLRELESLQSELKRLRRKCRQGSRAAACGILDDLRKPTDAKGQRSTRRSH